MKPFQQKLGSIVYLPSSRGRQPEETTTTRKKTTEKMTVTVEDDVCRVVAARRDCRSNEATVQKRERGRRPPVGTDADGQRRRREGCCRRCDLLIRMERTYGYRRIGNDGCRN
ncbi:hypothetical protein L2E82_15097 [Cichorium intybus]|uniref:Uncharacterized protein n=1 Tax=Cichorium intybus TaxID=13427 RepID=A0ACB9F2G3_CICIN|nr:hypothetical protein L2E82_15097 [Cichorium intybus]